VVSRVLPRKLMRDLWRQRWQFLATALVIAIGVSVYVAATDAYQNLEQSFARAYQTQKLPDAILSGQGVVELRDEVRRFPGDPVIALRQQGDVGLRVAGHTLLGRAVGLPAHGQPAVSQLDVRSGALPRRGEVIVEQHLADHHGLRPGDSVDLLGASGWRTFHISGSALSTEYYWPARSQQEILTTPEHFGVVFAPGTDLQQVLTEPVDQMVIYAEDRTEASELTDSASALASAEGLQFSSRDDQPSYRALQDDVEAVGTFASMLPWAFLTAAVLGTYVLLSRLVTAQRAVIGTLAANGVSGGALRRHYLGYGVAAGFAGSIPGLIAGYFLGGWFTTQYTDAIGLPLRVTSVHPRSLLVGAAVGTVAAALAAWAPARAAARTSPAEAMRVVPPGVRGGVSALERVVPPVRRVSARWRMTLRAITRNRRRTVLTVVGVAVSVTLVMVFAGLRDTVGSVIDRQYGAIQLEDAEVRTAPGAAGSVIEAVGADADVAATEYFGRYDVTLRTKAGQYQTMLVAMQPDTEMHRFTFGNSDLELPSRGLLLGQGARELLGVAVGDEISLAFMQTGRRVAERVAGFVDEPMNPVAYVSIGHLSQVDAASSPSGVLLKLNPGADEDTVSERIAAVPGVVAYLSSATVETAMRDAFSLYDALVALMLVFAALMAAALLYNAMSANVAERSVELGTMRAAGMGTGMLTRLVAAENLALVAVGVPVGLAAGRWLADWFMSRYETQGYQWSLDMQATTPIVVAVGVLLAALLAQLPALRAIHRIDVARIVRERSL
jgi:putative ABC transport system permease protein